MEPQPAAVLGPVLVAVAESSSPSSGNTLLAEADAPVPEVRLSSTLEPSDTNSPALPQEPLTAPRPEHSPR